MAGSLYSPEIITATSMMLTPADVELKVAAVARCMQAYQAPWAGKLMVFAGYPPVIITMLEIVLYCCGSRAIYALAARACAGLFCQAAPH